MKTCLLFVIAILFFYTNQEAMGDDMINLCQYTYGQFNTILPKIEQEFPIGLSVNNAMLKLAAIGTASGSYSGTGVFETYTGNKPEIANNKQSSEMKNGEIAWENGYTISSLFRCRLEKENQNVYNLDLHFDPEGRLVRRHFYLFFEDKNFASRGVDIRTHFFSRLALIGSSCRFCYLSGSFLPNVFGVLYFHYRALYFLR